MSRPAALRAADHQPGRPSGHGQTRRLPQLTLIKFASRWTKVQRLVDLRHTGAIAFHFDDLQSRRVKIVLDPAILFHRGAVGNIRDKIAEAFQLLGTDIVMAHAKELAPDGTAGSLAPGRGILDWNYYLDTLAHMNFSGAIGMHGLDEAKVGGATRFLRSKISD